MNASVGSVEDLVRLGLSRIDSEHVFQQWLSRIPSVGGGLDTATLQQQMQQAGMGQLPDALALAGQLSMPRVPSWKQLGVVQPMVAASAAAAREQHGATSGLPVANLQAPIQAAPAMRPQAPSASVNGRPAGDEHDMAVAARALNQFSQQLHSSGGHSEGTSPSSNDKDTAPDNRKARRMLSNRESARRSRKRKQEHLSKLEIEINAMLEEKRTWSEKAASLERHCSSIDDENRRLKEENERLRDELQFLRSELSSFTRRRARHHDGDDKRPAKQES